MEFSGNSWGAAEDGDAFESNSFPSPSPHVCNRSDELSQSIWFERYIAPHEPWLRRQLLAWARPCDIDDIVQDCFVKLLVSSEAGHHVDNPCGLIYRAARNLAIDRHRRKARVEFIAMDAEFDAADDAVNLEQAFDARCSLERVVEALNAMPATRRRIFQLSRFNDMPHKVLAAEVGLSVSAIEKNLRAAVAVLRQARDEPAERSIAFAD
ncbi:RNA polymerase sigma factor [Sphingomonas colocasiae]|uniref:Sigma-70 family RNA polymerase sigma factor n=1 Tax=Sphingomonas colocasiae TaxID=1848973 RepID=A0ABS7PKS3_9SPHN|nr:sigma-70 family RNA polymerase sigma factor [Sphingomonas colocasiae]MBY8821087.1 sigma-70 family RNA polymerase sigma factor [Sphingomonas colocasiae]